MTADGYPRLCGGTFFSLLLQARKQRKRAREHRRGERDGLSDTDMLVGLLKVFNPDYIEPSFSTIGTFKTNTSDYKSCKISSGTYLPFSDTAAFDNRVKSCYAVPLGTMRDFVNTFIDVGTSAEKDIRLVKALLELIDADQSIDSDQIFYAREGGSTRTKASLRGETSIYLPSFLLSVWHFVLVNRKDNTVGKATYDDWCPPNGGAARTYTGNIGDGITRPISVTAIAPDNMDTEGGSSVESHDPVVDDDIHIEPKVYPATTTGYTAATQDRAINLEYYNLIVTGDEIKNNRLMMEKNRTLQGESAAVKQFAGLSAEAIARIKTLPSLIMNENTDYGGRTKPRQKAVFGFVTDLKIQENGFIRIRFKCIAKVNQQRINEIAHKLDIFSGRGVMELNHSHWTIKNVDLIEELTDAGLLPSEGILEATI